MGKVSDDVKNLEAERDALRRERDSLRQQIDRERTQLKAYLIGGPKDGSIIAVARFESELLSPYSDYESALRYEPWHIDYNAPSFHSMNYRVARYRMTGTLRHTRNAAIYEYVG